MRSHRGTGLFQRFVNYLDEDFGARDRPRAGDAASAAACAWSSAGPNAFVYFVDTDEPLTIDEIDARLPAASPRTCRARPGVGFVLARSAERPRLRVSRQALPAARGRRALRGRATTATIVRRGASAI